MIDLNKLREEAAARVEGDSDSPLRVAAANLILSGKRDEVLVPELVKRVEQLEEALRQWKCGACGGSGRYLNKRRGLQGFIAEEVPCKVCDGTGGDPIAHQALGDRQ